MPIVGLPIVTFPPLSRSLLKLYKSCKFADPLLTISTSLVHVTCAPVTCTTVYMLLMSYCSSAFHCNAHLVLCSSSVSMRVGVCKPFQLVMRRQRWHLREPLSIEATFIWSLSAGYALTRNTLCAKVYRYSESLAKSNGKKWSQIWNFLLKIVYNCHGEKSFFTDFVSKKQNWCSLFINKSKEARSKQHFQTQPMSFTRHAPA